MVWIVYLLDTLIIQSVSDTEPSVGPGEGKAQVTYQFPLGQSLSNYKYIDPNVVVRSDAELNTGNSNERIIYSEDDFEVVAGKNMLEDGVAYEQRSKVLTLTRSFDVSQITTQTTWRSNTQAQANYLGPEALFQGTYSGVLDFFRAVFVGTGNQRLFDITGNGSPLNVLGLLNFAVANFRGFGKINNLGRIAFSTQTLTEVGESIICSDVTNIFISDINKENVSSTNTPTIVVDGNTSSVIINSNSVTPKLGESFIQFSTDISVQNLVSLNGNAYNDILGGDFLAPAINDSITSFGPNGSGGTTVTPTVPTALRSEQKTIISGTTNYDGVQRILSVADGGISFDIDAPFAGNDATGTSSTGDSNDFLDNNSFNISNNGIQKNSSEIAKLRLMNSPIIVTPLVVGVPVPIQGLLNDWDDTLMRRFEYGLGDPGTFQYTGVKKDLSSVLSASITADASGGGQVSLSAYLTVNGVVLDDSVSEGTSNRFKSFNPNTIFELNNADNIGIAIANNDNLNQISVSVAVTSAYSQK